MHHDLLSNATNKRILKKKRPDKEKRLFVFYATFYIDIEFKWRQIPSSLHLVNAF